MDSKKSGFSEADNEAAGRLLLMAVFAVVAVIFLMVSPILIGGFLIGLIWYGAYVKDGDKNGESVIWPVAITLTVFVYLFGLPQSDLFQGVLFSDFHSWTSGKVGSVLSFINQILPKKMMIKNISVDQAQLYFWLMIAFAIASFVYLHFRGAGRGQFLYKGFWYILTPLRMLSAKIWWVAVLGALLLVSSKLLGLSYWFKSGCGFLLMHMMVYSVHINRKEIFQFGGTEASDSKEKPLSRGPIVIGHERERSYKKVVLSDDELNHHVHILGASGFGKSVLLSHIIQNRIQSKTGMLFVDLKADFETIRQVVSIAKKSDRLNDLCIFSCANPEISNYYNVLGSGSANQLKDRIMGALNWSEEFYKNEASSFLLKLLRGLVLLRELKSESFDLRTILKCADDIREIEGIIDRLPKDQVEIRNSLEGLVFHLSKSENQKALRGLRSQIESLVLSDFGYLLTDGGPGNNRIELFNAIRSGKIVYVLLDSRRYGESSKALGKLILQDLKSASARIDNEIPRDQRQNFTVVVDEFSDMVTEDFISFLDRARSSKIGVVVAHQEIADLDRISPEFAKRLMNSTSTCFSFLQKLPSSSELVAGIGGTKKTKEVTEQAKSNWLFGDEKTGMKSIKEVDEFIIHPNVIRSLGVGECVMIQKYPRSRSVVVKVRPEEKTNYLLDEEVVRSLNGFAQKQARTMLVPRNEIKAQVNSSAARSAEEFYKVNETGRF